MEPQQGLTQGLRQRARATEELGQERIVEQVPVNAILPGLRSLLI
jgi:hypothetical protein